MGAPLDHHSAILAAEPQAAPAAPALPAPDELPLRLRDALGRRKTLAGAPARDLKLPLIGHLPLKKQLSILSTVMALSLAASLLFVTFNMRSGAIASAQTQLASDALMHSQRLGKAAPNAVQGNPEAFRQLEESRNELDQDFRLMVRGGAYHGRDIGESRAGLLAAVADARKKWASSDRAAGTILRLKAELGDFDKALQQLNALSPKLLAQTEEIAALKVQRGGSARELAVIGRLMMLTQRMSRSASGFLATGSISSETAFALGRDATYFRAAVEGLLNGSAALQLPGTRDAQLREQLLALKTSFDAYQTLVSAILDRLEKFSAAKSAEQLIFSENEDLRQRLTLLQQMYHDNQETLDLSFWLMVASVLLTLIAAAGMGRVLLQDSVNRTREASGAARRLKSGACCRRKRSRRPRRRTTRARPPSCA